MLRRRHLLAGLGAAAAVGALFFANGFGFATWAARVPAVREGLGLSDGELGSALFAIGLGALLVIDGEAMAAARVMLYGLADDPSSLGWLLGGAA